MDIDQEWRPDYGSLTHEFSFDPLHYGVGGDRRRKFTARVQEELRAFGFVFNNEVRVRWELFVDEQERLETPAGADVDNFAKLLNDSIKGASGLLIDDSQIQRLEIAWVPSRGEEGFQVSIECHSDAFTSKPFKMYEMPDGMWYPITDFGEPSSSAQAAVCGGLAFMVARYRRVRHHLRSRGATRTMAYDNSAYVKPSAMGFHKTRVVDSDLRLVAQTEWRPGLATLSESLRKRIDKSRADIEAEATALAEALLPGSRS